MASWINLALHHITHVLKPRHVKALVFVIVPFTLIMHLIYLSNFRISFSQSFSHFADLQDHPLVDNDSSYTMFFDRCSYYSSSNVQRSNGDSNYCDRIPSVFCGNGTTCEQVSDKVKQFVLCEIGRNFRVPRKRPPQSCKPTLIKYSCEMLRITSLPCTRDFYVEEFNFHTQSHCLQRIARSLYSKEKVPPIHHQVWFHDQKPEMEFFQYISFLSHLRFFRPKAVFIWNNGNLPTSKWWLEIIAQHNQPTSKAFTEINESQSEDRIVRRKVALFQTKIYSIQRNPPQNIYEMPIAKIQHKSDVTRLEALLMFGGFYADVDTISLRSHEPLLKYAVTMGLEDPVSLTNMAIFAQPHAPHLYNWHYSYSSFDKKEWSEWSVQRNYRLAKRCPHYVHIEAVNMASPNWSNRFNFTSGVLNISQSYTTHLYWRYINQTYLASPAELHNANFLAHRIFRGIYYNSCDVCG